MNDLTSIPSALSMDEEIVVIAIGTEIHAELERSAPLVTFPKKNCPIFSPAPMNNGTIKKAINNEKTKDEVILLLMFFVSSVQTEAERSGMRAVESEPTRVIGMNKRGIVIPIAIP